MKRVTSFFPPIAIDRDKRRTLYRQLYDWFRGATLSGQLRPGQRIPSSRSLAAELKISRIPVVAAFEQLHAEGYLETRTGSGTFVARLIPDHMTRPAMMKHGAPAQLQQPRKISQCATALLSAPPQTWLNKLAAFRVSLPALDHFPVNIWSRLVARHAREMSVSLMAYSDAMGYLPLRRIIADYLGAVRGVRCEASQVMVVTGSQQGLQLCARVLLNPKDRVWMEEPGYPGAHQSFQMAGAHVVPVPVDDEGLRVGEGTRHYKDARAAYVTPSHQYPLGMTMSAARRMLLLDWATRTGSWIIEDDYDSEYRFGARPIGSLQGLDTSGRVLYIGTFSKVLFPALRIGYVIVPNDLVPAFTAVREASDIFSSTFYQAVLADFIQQGHFARHIRRMRMLYMERRDLLVKLLRGDLGGLLEIAHAEAGMHLVALLTRRNSDVAVCQEAARHGISAMPLSSCYLRKAAQSGLILGYGGTDARQIQEGVRGLAACMRNSIGAA